MLPLCAAGVPGGSPTCSAVATKQNEFLMLTCDWAGGEPRVTLWWRDWRDHVLGGLKPSHSIFVMKSNNSLGGKEFTCMAAHPLQKRTAECHIRLGERIRTRGIDARRGRRYQECYTNSYLVEGITLGKDRKLNVTVGPRYLAGMGSKHPLHGHRKMWK